MLLLNGCAADPVSDAPDSPENLAYRQSLDVIKSKYNVLNLPEAMLRARSLRAALDSTTHSVNPALRAELYQYLAMLHFDHASFSDSVAYYTEAAKNLPVDLQGPEFVARQLLCAAYTGFFNRAWIEIQMMAHLGRESLREENQIDETLYGRLLLIQAVAAKKYGDGSSSNELRDQYYAEAEQLLREAIDRLNRKENPLERRVWEELVILNTRFPSRGAHTVNLIDTVGQQCAPNGEVVGFTDWLLGYWHQRRGRADSSQVYFRRHLERGPQFCTGYADEARFLLQFAAVERQDYPEAKALNLASMGSYGCCPDQRAPHPSDLSTCLERPSCVFFLAAQAGIYLHRYRKQGDRADLDTAVNLSNLALQSYQSSFPSMMEEAVLNRINVIGNRLLDVALSAAVEHARVDQRIESYNAILRAMELGKTFLLLGEQIALQQAGEVGHQLAISEINSSIKLLKQAYADRSDRSESALAQYRQASSNLNDLERRANTKPFFLPEVHRTGDRLRIASVRETLAPNEAFVEFAETDGGIYGLFIDRDTVVVYDVAPAALEKIDPLIRQLMDHNQPPIAAFAQLSFGLFNDVFGPVKECLTKNSMLSIVPSTSLEGIPFPALLYERDTLAQSYAGLPYLVKRHEVRQLGSWRTDRELHKRRQPLGKTLRIGSWTHPELDGYLAEVSTFVLAHPLTTGDHHRGSDCNRNSFLAHKQEYDLIHLSVHARGNPARLHDNYLYLSTRDSINGLTVGQAPLRARLVVLAACSTASGFGSRGEGTFSLRRSFHLAGVPDVVSSVFDVPAAATATLLDRFYTHLLAGKPPAAALSLAQRASIDGQFGPRYSFPGYWAGLILG
ncbi:CHAT domain-containing protein [Lewinella aquimaris]|uniref:CHAT domain-containing protein n=1 Tax=Neolewinella aquimaris TaxID=1835722 RepID=A0A840ED89_9BACT|nr:CHAT domain-containing protein [Neolewinella aquimaris]MBB4079769.1 CHAT domain-containing protein [Neolewinella aquimaris]